VSNFYPERLQTCCLLTPSSRRPDAPWNFLNAYKSAAQSVPRTALVTEMVRNVVVARFVTSALPKAVKHRTAHRALVTFHTAALFEYISRIEAPDDGVLVFLLPAMLEPLQHQAGTKDVVVSAPSHSYLQFSQACSAVQLCAPLSAVTKSRTAGPCHQSHSRCDGLRLLESGTTAVRQCRVVGPKSTRST
jgi:hypothetical protein